MRFQPSPSPCVRRSSYTTHMSTVFTFVKRPTVRVYGMAALLFVELLNERPTKWIRVVNTNIYNSSHGSGWLTQVASSSSYMFCQRISLELETVFVCVCAHVFGYWASLHAGEVQWSRACAVSAFSGQSIATRTMTLTVCRESLLKRRCMSTANNGNFDIHSWANNLLFF